MNKLIGAVSLIIAVAIVAFVGTVETHYTMNGVVVNKGTVELVNGQCYEFQDDRIKVGTHLSVYMDNNGTDTNLYDDKIVRYTIVG